MSHLNIEIKAKCDHLELIRKYLVAHNAEFKGIDHQTDTYFNVFSGRLKLREGNIENNLIYYQRENKAAARESNFKLVKLDDSKALKDALAGSLGIKVVVIKKREIYFIGNVKFHLDEISSLGNFVEIEASDLYAPLFREELQKQCDFYAGEFGLQPGDMVGLSYSDMLLHETVTAIEED